MPIFIHFWIMESSFGAILAIAVVSTLGNLFPVNPSSGGHYLL